MFTYHVWPTNLYGYAVWTIKEMLHKINAFDMWTYRRILHIPLTDRIKNEEVLHQVGKQRVELTLRKTSSHSFDT